MSQQIPGEQIRDLLDRDRVWSAYALADLDPSFRHLSVWFTNGESVLLIYHGLDPAVLFAMGEPSELESLFMNVSPGRYIYTLMGYCRALIRDRLQIENESHMWRMALKYDEFPGTSHEGVVKLGLNDLERIQALISGHPDRPDSFTTSQLETGVFFGYPEGTELLSLAGTHIVSQWAGVGAIGNVFTRPDRRGQGLATMVTSAVVAELISQGIETVVLNVSMDNQPALACYRKLGFTPFCGYYEGTATLVTAK
jgi:ribosomal protein S18 acetylase RimI-like enzyme